MLRKTILAALAAAFLTLATTPEAWAWGAAHVGYTHVGPNGDYHYGRTEVYGGGTDAYRGGGYDAYRGGSYDAYRGGTAASGYRYTGTPAGGAYEYRYAATPAGGVRVGYVDYR
jgi:hypothetical protein